MKKLRIICILGIVLISIWLIARPSENPTQSVATKTTQQQGFNNKLFSIDDPASQWVVVNKKRPLNPSTYKPNDLTVPQVTLRTNITSDEKQMRKTAAEHLALLAGAAEQQGVHLTLESGYRSYDFQKNLYSSYVKQQGQAVADTQSARPGFSEHQTGLAADLGGVTKPSCNIEACFADTTEGKWLAANVSTYGFVIRYPANGQDTTGYVYEPWHIRYVGIELANEMKKQNSTTLEDFFKTGAAGSY